jgi:antitoxin component YwqK of YwqJK toxin-antitoxin module
MKKDIKPVNNKGQKHGYHIIYDSRGTLWREENYVNGKLHGTYKTYYENGLLWYQCEYHNGKRHALLEYYNNKTHKLSLKTYYI